MFLRPGLCRRNLTPVDDTMRTIFLSLLLLAALPEGSLAEANVPDEQGAKSPFLLTAPGTLSGMPDNEAPADSAANGEGGFPPTSQPFPLRFKTQEYDNHVESYKFPQYGQVSGRNNPWSEQESNRPLPPLLPPANPYYSNPWDLSGRFPASPQGGYQGPPAGYPAMPQPYPYDPAGAPPGYNPYANRPGYSPDFPGGIYRDTNPAMGPFFDGMLPGMGGEDFDFPFAPFNMF